MKLALYQVDAFTTEVFKGNPAAVCPLDSWLPAATMQNIAKENNLSYWQTQLHKKSFHAYQVSPRGGEIWCEIKNDRVFLSGHAVLYMKGEILW